jgi:dimethylargininase
MRIAIVREVSPNIHLCELTHLERQPIDYLRACQQHTEYQIALRQLGLDVLALPAETDLPDSVFVEDTAIVLDEVAVITRPGARSRRAETEKIAPVLARYRELIYLQEPAVLDGGDVLRVGKVLFVGLTTRTNQAALDQLEKFLTPLGYQIEAVQVNGALHLKTAVTQVSKNMLLVNRQKIELSPFAGFELIHVDPGEPMAGNALLIDQQVIYPAGFVRTRTRLEAAGVAVLPVPADELGKAEGGVTCCSLILNIP